MSNEYKDVLVAIDGSEESQQILERARSVCCGTSGRLHLLHVIEPLALAYGADIPIDVTELQTGIMDQARTSVRRYADTYGIPAERVYVEMGSIEKTIQEKAEALDVDLIVVGSHTRTGLAILLGSTARGVVPGARCDVLAVKIQKCRN
ncbi:universal stress protein [Isoalcanivorax beigongshangi]|uniref:Universal stress protein n=1 Tax=Isoalcanivorax beigongshangi TaxID=3238810 RepID=A0ABV4AGI3_9GAMM